MAYTKTVWTPRQGTNLNKFNKSAETPTSVILVNAPDSVAQQGTPFSVDNMNKIEQGIADAHKMIDDNFKTLTSHADMVDGVGRNLLDVLGVSSIPDAMAAIRARGKGTGVPDFSGPMIGDYLDNINLSAIPAHGGGTAGQAWNGSYKNNQIVIAGFNTFKGVGDTENAKNHILFAFRNIIFQHRMNPTDANAGGYTASELRVFLEGANGNGTGEYAGDPTVPVAAVLNALKAQIGDYIYPIRKYHGAKGPQAWNTYSLWLPSELEVFGTPFYGEEGLYMPALTSPALPARAGYITPAQIPLFQKGFAYRIKKYNGARNWWWEQTPLAASAATFAFVSGGGSASNTTASNAAGGVAPVFCVA
jgi:hypothetical protein